MLSDVRIVALEMVTDPPQLAECDSGDFNTI
jgi:hypothetical protein